MSQSSQSQNSHSSSSLIPDISMDIDSGNTNIYTPAYLSKNYNNIVFPDNSTSSSSSSNISQSTYSSTLTNSQFSE